MGILNISLCNSGSSKNPVDNVNWNRSTSDWKLHCKRRLWIHGQLRFQTHPMPCGLLYAHTTHGRGTVWYQRSVLQDLCYLFCDIDQVWACGKVCVRLDTYLGRPISQPGHFRDFSVFSDAKGLSQSFGQKKKKKKNSPTKLLLRSSFFLSFDLLMGLNIFSAIVFIQRTPLGYILHH